MLKTVRKAAWMRLFGHGREQSEVQTPDNSRPSEWGKMKIWIVDFFLCLSAQPN